jgi:predicted Zn-dependent peptidase
VKCGETPRHGARFPSTCPTQFDPEEIEREKGVIVEDEHTTTPRVTTSTGLRRTSLLRHPLGWDIIGRKETVRAAERDTFFDYLDRWYRAPRMVAGVAGNLGDDLNERLQELLGDVPDGQTGQPEPATWSQEAPQVKLHTKQSDQAHIRIGVHSYPLDHPDRYALGLLATVLGGGMSSRLFTEVRERRGLAYYIYGHNMAYTDTGTLYAQGGVDIKRIDDAVTTVVKEFGRIAAEPVEADELEKARNSPRVASSSRSRTRKG